MDGARLHFRSFDAYGDKDAMDSANGLFRLVFPPFHGLVNVFCQGFHLRRVQVEVLDPFFFCKRLRKLILEDCP